MSPTPRRSPLALAALLVTVTSTATAPAIAQPAPAAPRGPADIISGARRARERKEMEQQAATADRAAQAAPPDPHAGVPGAPPLAPGSDPHAGVPGAPPTGPGSDPHAGVPGAPPMAPGADPHAGVPGAPPLAPGSDPHAGVPGAPPVAGTANPHGGGAMPQTPTLQTSAAPSAAVPVGTIAVRVVDATGAPVPGAEIRLGVMGQGDQRSSQMASADARGEHRFTDLPVGAVQAYRVNVERGGARFSTTPFRLPADSGYEATLVALNTTREHTAVVLYVGATSIELKEERLKIAQQARLINVSGDAYLFPEGGARIPLPPGATAFQAEKSMGDQTVELVDDVVRVTGSLAPGQTTLLWGFDLPIDGSEMDLALDVPWLTFAYRVISDAPPGMSLSVDGFPEARTHDDEGRSFWVTEIQRRPGDAPFERLAIHLRGIPGPGPLRWVAAGLALLAVLAGAALSLRARPAAGPVDRSALLARQKALLAQARDLDAERREGEIGAEYHAEALQELTDELALVLEQIDTATEKKPSGSAAGATSARSTR